MRNTDLLRQINEIIDAGADTYRPEYEKLAKSSNPEDQEKCFLIASRLRKRGYTSQAFLASELLSNSFPSLKSYNIYLISAYDLTYKGDKNVANLYKVFQDTWDFYQKNSFEPNITATLLKCCNYLILHVDDIVSKNETETKIKELSDTFDQIYNKCPDDEKNKNSFIIAQCFRRLIAEGKKEQVLVEFEQLSPELQKNRTLCNIVNHIDADYKKKANFNSSLEKELKKWTVISIKEELTKLTEVLESFSIIVSQVEIQSESLAEDLNQSTYKSEKAIIIIPKGANDINMERWAFALGYCIHKFGKGNTVVLVDQMVKINDNSILNLYNPTAFKDQLELVKQLGSFGLISG